MLQVDVPDGKCGIGRLNTQGRVGLQWGPPVRCNVCLLGEDDGVGIRGRGADQGVRRLDGAVLTRRVCGGTISHPAGVLYIDIVGCRDVSTGHVYVAATCTDVTAHHVQIASVDVQIPIDLGGIVESDVARCVEDGEAARVQIGRHGVLDPTAAAAARWCVSECPTKSARCLQRYGSHNEQGT